MCSDNDNDNQNEAEQSQSEVLKNMFMDDGDGFNTRVSKELKV